VSKMRSVLIPSVFVEQSMWKIRIRLVPSLLDKNAVRLLKSFLVAILILLVLMEFASMLPFRETFFVNIIRIIVV